MKVELFCLFLVIFHFSFYECQENLQSKKDDEDIVTRRIDEWQRYINYNRKLIIEMRRKIKQRIKDKLFGKTNKENKVVAPSFVLSRTKSGLVVKQHEAGSKSESKGGFEFPTEPLLLTNIEFKYDGSISPVVKLSETKTGLVGKKLEFGKAKSPGLNWDSRSGSSQIKDFGRSGETIDDNGMINKGAGISKNFSDGSINKRGSFKNTFTRSSNLRNDTFEPNEVLPDDESYSNEGSEYESDDNNFEKTDAYYDETEVIEGGQYEADYIEDNTPVKDDEIEGD